MLFAIFHSVTQPVYLFVAFPPLNGLAVVCLHLIENLKSLSTATLDKHTWH